jgi:hypothetical protein
MKFEAPRQGGQMDGSSKTIPCSYQDASFQNEKDNLPGVGTASAVKWISAQWDTPDGQRPPVIGLAHELVHAWNNALGTSCKDDAQNEKTVVGLLPTNNNPVTENAIRMEHGSQPADELQWNLAVRIVRTPRIASPRTLLCRLP